MNFQKDHVILTYDIEVEMESGLPDTQKVREWYYFHHFHDSATNEYYVLVLDKTGKMEEKKTKKGQLVLPFRDERDLLQKYLELYEMINPSIVTGWNIDYFDTPYLYNRIKRLLGERQSQNRLSPIGECFWSPYRQRFFIVQVYLI